jgi:hypothetical protein
MPFGNFDREQEVFISDHLAFVGGPIDPDVKRVQEICAWIVQMTESGDDAAATEMADVARDTDSKLVLFKKGVPVSFDTDYPDTWKMLVEQKGDTEFVGGKPGLAMAIAKSVTSDGKERIESWTQTVDVVPAKPETARMVEQTTGVAIHGAAAGVR